MKLLSLAQLRAGLYKIVDHAIATRRSRFVPEKKQSKLNNLVKHPGTIICNPEELVHIEWYKHLY